jgi:tetratricopeptide (TPR) repeat protein
LAVNKRKVLEAARKFAQKGAKEKALKEYEKLLKLDPRDAKLRLEIGDAHRRWGQTEEAIDTYNKVADQYMKEGFDARAVAVFKQILNLDPDNLDSYEPLAELYQRMGLAGEATAALQTAADGFHKAGDKETALGMLRKMATLDPSNTTSRVKVADLLHQEGMDSEAVLEYDAVAEELERQNDVEGSAKVYERILDIDAGRIVTLVAYTRNLLSRGAHEAAEPFAKRALDADPSPEQYELLGEVLRQAGRDEELVELYRKLAEVYRERGDEERTREILQRYVPPDDFSATDTGGEFLDGGGDLPVDDLSGSDLDLDSDVQFDDSTMLDEDLLADDSLLLGDDESGIGAMPGLDSGDSLSMVDPNAASASGPDSNEMTRILPEAAPDPPADTDQMFAEASVYLRYGKRDQAIANLEAILEREPSHRAAMEKLGEACADTGNVSRAVELWNEAAKIAVEDGEAEAAAAIRERIALLDPSSAPPAAVPDDPDTADVPIPLSEDIDNLSGTGDDLEVGEIELDDIEVDIDAGSIVENAASSSAAPAAEATMSARPESSDARAEALTQAPAGASASATASINEDLEEADFYYQQGLLEEAEAIYQRVLDLAPNHPHALVRMGEVAAQRGDDPGSTGAADAPAAAPPAAEIDVPEEPAAMDIGDELASWGEESADELDIGAPPETFEEPEEELSAADLSIDLSLDSPAPEPPAVKSAVEPEADADDADVEIDIDIDADIDLDLGLDDSEPDQPTPVAPLAAPDDPDLALDDDGDDWVSGLADQVPDEPMAPAAGTLAGPGDVADDLLGADEGPSAAFDLTSGDDSTGQVRVDASVAAASAPSDDAESDPLHADTSVDFDEIDEIDDEPETEAPQAELGDQTDPNAIALPTACPTEPEDHEETADDAVADDFGFDLAAEIGQALDEDTNGASSDNHGTADDGFAAVFAEFKKGVSETLSEGDHEAHYDLGIAYREMGLFDDAIGEFRAAMNHPGRMLGAQHMMALCQIDAGQTEDAIGNLEMALASDGVEGQHELALRLDLGRAHEQAGDLDAARQSYEAVQAVDAGFSDVDARLAGLDDPDKQDPALGSDDTGEYETFEGFLDEDEPDAASDEPEPAEPESYENFDDVMDDLDDDDEPESAEDEPEAPPEAVADAMPDEPEAVAEVVAAPGLEDESSVVEAAVEFEPEVQVEPEPEAQAEPEFEPEPEAEPVTALEAEPEIEADPEPEPEPAVEPEPEPAVEPEPEPAPEPEKKRKKRKISFF